jgi:hypothetical protein
MYPYKTQVKIIQVDSGAYEDIEEKVKETKRNKLVTRSMRNHSVVVKFGLVIVQPFPIMKNKQNWPTYDEEN